MMTCAKCRKSFDRRQAKCPHCGEPNPRSAGLFQTSAVLISTGDSDMVYRSVDEVPASLRSKLLESTNGQNSATILIADRRGREEVAKAVRAIPGAGQKRLAQSLVGARARAAGAWLAGGRRIALLVLTVLAAVAAVAFVWLHRWR